MDEIVAKIAAATGIIVFTGAGVSTSCGIPDYRSATGLYSTRPSFTRSDINNPEYTKLVATMRDATPSETHLFCTMLHDMGKLIRVYTQNIDRLHTKAGLPGNMVVEMHGSIDSDVVFFGEDIPSHVINQIKIDLVDDVGLVDLVLVFGTSLQVMPFAALPNMVRKNCTRILINDDLSMIRPLARKHKQEGLESRMCSSVKICGRKVATSPSWENSSTKESKLHLSKWSHQYLCQAKCDDWVRQVSTLMK
jgi:NAD-dependent SIR2 family protein deacetylase